MSTLKRSEYNEELDKKAVLLLNSWISKQLEVKQQVDKVVTKEDFYLNLSNGIQLGLWIDLDKPSYGLKTLLNKSLPTVCTTPTEMAQARENLSHVLTAIRNIYRLKTIDLFEPADLMKKNNNDKNNVISCLLRIIPLMKGVPKELKDFSDEYLNGGNHYEEPVGGGSNKKEKNAKEPEWKPITPMDELVYTAWQPFKNKITIKKEEEPIYSFQRHKVIVTLVMKRPFVQIGIETIPLSRFLDGLATR